MGMYLNPGNGMFQRTLDAEFYVDKTGLASFLNGRMGTSDAFVCVSRPRRFGKSVDANMLVAYYSRGADSRAQFEGLAVASDPSFERHLNAHDVIKIDMTKVLDRRNISADIGAEVTRRILPEIRAAWPDAVPEGVDGLADALFYAAEAKGSGFIFVIDEWDFAMREAVDDEEMQDDYLFFLRLLLKDQPYVDACYMTGILPIKRYSTHSSLNMFAEYTMTSPKNLTPFIGFSSHEVKELCDRFGMDFAEMQRWYDGYLVGPERAHAYNPRSVAGAIGSKTLDSFWARTETYEALQRYIDIDFDGVASDLLLMLDGAKVPADVGGFANTMTGLRDKGDVYALLVHLGYLGYDEVERAVFIPNEEIRREFVNALRGGARPEIARLVEESRALIRATLDGDESYVADALDRAHSWAAAPLWYNDEQALRAAVKFAYIAALDDYLRVDELPGGRGYADVVFVPKPASPLSPMVVELKWDRPADAALDRIRARNYPAALSGLAGECVLCGVTYDADTKRHECRIDRVEL